MNEERKGQWSLSGLAEAAGIPARTIRFYIARQLLPGPCQAGRGAYYGAEHLEKLRQIKKFQAEGKTLAEMVRSLGEREETSRLIQPTGWWNYQLAEDVVVMVRSDSSPWRLRQIQKSLSRFAIQIGNHHPEERENADNE